MDDGRAAREQSLRLEDREFLFGRRIASDALRDVDREALGDGPIHAPLERADVENEGPDVTGGEPQLILVLGVPNQGPKARIVGRGTLDRGDPAEERLRSEERRVGKECRSRWAPYQCKEKKRRSRYSAAISKLSQ